MTPTKTPTPSGAQAGEAFGGGSGGFEGCPGGLQEEAFLRVHGLGFEGRDVEEEGVEAIDVLDEAAPFGVGAAFAAVGVEVLGDVPAVCGDFGDGLGALADQGPEVLAAGEAGVVADDGDGFGGVGLWE